MMVKPRYILALSQIFFGLSIFICLILIPRYFTEADQGGISNYGTEPTTSPFFIFGFLSAALGVAYAAFYTKVSRSQKINLTVLAAMYLLVMVSTFAYRVDGSQESRHQLAALMLIIVMTVYFMLSRSSIAGSVASKAASLLYIVGLILGLLTSVNITTQLLSAQILTGVSFGYLLCASIGPKS